MHLLINPLRCCQHMHDMADQRRIKGYFGVPVKQLKRKAKPSAEKAKAKEKKKQSNSPTVQVRKFQESWKYTDTLNAV